MMTIEERGRQNAERKNELNKMRWLATSLLVISGSLYVLGKVFSLGYLAAFAEAAMIGGLADWFAVVALFRHPLGLPIPHTAIITRNRRSLADSLAEFVVGQFLSAEVIGERLKRYDAARHVSQWLVLSENRNRVTEYLRQGFMYAVHALDDRRIHDFLVETARNKLQSIDLSGFMGSGLAMITQDQRHYKILHGGLNRFADYVESPDNNEVIIDFIKGWSDNAFVQSMIEPFVPTIRKAVVNKLRAVSEDESNGLYLEFNLQIQSYVQRLQQDDLLRDWVDAQKQALLSRPEFALQIESLWEQLHNWLAHDLTQPESVISEKIEGLVGQLECQLLSNAALRSWINDQIQTALIQAANTNKSVVGDLIREEFARWDDKDLVNKLELYLGRDLQYIRINGTLVGGLFGLLIYVVTQWVLSGL